MARAEEKQQKGRVGEVTANKTYRIAIVGASSLAGKELSDALSESSFAASSFTLLDEDKVTGQIAAAGDEISFIQKIDASSFEGMDFVFFAGDGDVALKYWGDARKKGAAIIDLTSALEGLEGVVICSPWVAAARAVTDGNVAAAMNLETSVVVSAHPAAVMLGMVVTKLTAKFDVKSVAVTVLEPASQYGRPAMDELHQQTVSLLSFQSLPQELYGTQVAFNMLAAPGEEAKLKFVESEARIETQYRAILPGAPAMALQLIHAPVFHGYVASIFVELGEVATMEQVEISLVGEHIDIVAKESDPPSNLTAAGQEEIMIRVDAAGKTQAESSRFKLLVAADNLRLAAANAIACARELAQLRPLGKVQ